MSASAELHSIGTAFNDINGRLYPVIGIGDQEVKVTVNFGQNDFLFKDLPLIYYKATPIPM